jgi:hypothetical protein
VIFLKKFSGIYQLLNQYAWVKEIYSLRQAWGAGDAGEAGGEIKAYLNRIDS